MSRTYKDDDFYYEDKDEPFFNTEPHQEVEFLNDLDKGYIGLETPQIEKHIVTRQQSYWIRRKLEDSKRLGIPLHDMADEPDNDPASPEEAWA